MAFGSQAIAYYAFHITSMPLSLILFIFYKNHKYYPSIAYFALTLLFSSINSCFLAFLKKGDIENTANTIPCDIQAFFVSYLNSSAALWPVCIESNMTLILLRKRRRQQQGGWSRNQLLLSFMVLSWGLPLFFTISAFVMAVNEKGLKPWLYYCMISEPSIGPAIGIYFVSLCTVLATIIMSAWNVKLVCDQEVDSDESKDIELSKRTITFGIIITLPICLATLARSFFALINNTVDSREAWPDFLLVTMPYIAFIIFGIRPELIKQILPKSAPCQRNRGDSLLLRFSIINPTLRRTMAENEQRLSLTLAEKSSLEEPISETASCSSIPGPSTFSQRSDPRAPNPFSHRKNPSLTINVPHQNHNNRINKGKDRASVAKRKSFLARALSMNKPENQKGGNGYINPKSMKATKKHSPRRRAGMINDRRSPFFDIVDGKARFLKTFSFEHRKKFESVIGMPSRYIIDNNFNDQIRNSDVTIDIKDMQDELKRNSYMSINEYSTTTVEECEKEKRERLARKAQLLSRYPKPPPLALNQNNKSSPSNPKSPSFFFLDSDHYDNDNDEYTNLPVTPSFGTSPSKNQIKRNSKSSSSSKSNNSKNSTESSKSSHGGGLRLTPRNSIPVQILNRKSLIDALPKLGNRIY